MSLRMVTSVVTMICGLTYVGMCKPLGDFAAERRLLPVRVSRKFWLFLGVYLVALGLAGLYLSNQL